MFTFPAIKRDLTIDFQLDKILEEIEEFEIAPDADNKDEEAIDILHAVETLVRIQFKGREDILDNLVKQVIAKNSKRGKY